MTNFKAAVLGINRTFSILILCVIRLWHFFGLVLVLAVLSSIPIVQFICLGYLLSAASNLSLRKPWASGLPNLELSGRVVTFLFIAGLCWIPVWIVSNLAYSSQLLMPDTAQSSRWRLLAFSLTALWLIYVVWVAIRGGRWWQWLWPEPIKFLKQFFRRRTWADLSDRLYDLIQKLNIAHYWWLGAQATFGALLWLVFPAAMMVAALRFEQMAAPGVIALIGTIGMLVVSLYLPFTQIQFARSGQFRELFNVRSVRDRFKYAPWIHAVSLIAVTAFTFPLYLVRIEATPSQLLWLPSLVFVLFSLPMKLLAGVAMGYASHRELQAKPWRNWLSRWAARIVCIASSVFYIGTLYLAQLIAGQGAMILFLQHAYIVPPPMISS